MFQIHDSGEDLQFRNKVVYKFLPELSVGPETASITVLNMVMMTAFNKVRSQPSFVKSGVILPLLQSLGRSEPILNITVQGKSEYKIPTETFQAQSYPSTITRHTIRSVTPHKEK